MSYGDYVEQLTYPDHLAQKSGVRRQPGYGQADHVSQQQGAGVPRGGHARRMRAERRRVGGRRSAPAVCGDDAGDEGVGGGWVIKEILIIKLITVDFRLNSIFMEKQMIKEKTQLETILDSIDALAERVSVSRQKAFAAWYAENFFDADEDEVLDLVAMDGGEDQGIDLVYPDKQTGQIFVIQAHCPENLSKSTPRNKWDAVTSAISAYDSPDIFQTQGRKELFEHISSVKDKFADYGVVFGLISLGLNSDSIGKTVENTKKSTTFSAFDFFYLSQSEIVNRYAALVANEKGVADDVIEFETSYIQDQGKYGKAWFGSVSANELIRLHSKYKNNLFSGNVRLFMGTRKGGINEHIVKTAKEDSGLFWALNNGISIVANTVEPLDGDSKTLRLHRFSIVNGCQTTSCLAEAGATDAKVLLRVIAATPAVVTDIVRYNNSQNAVKIWAVRSVDDTQERLRAEFRKSGISYAPKQEGARKKANEKDSIDLDKLTQYLASTKIEYLILAINAKTELFDQPYQNIFTHDISASYVYLCWRIGVTSDDIRKSRLDTIKKDNPDKISIALLGVSATYWIVYCAAKIINAENKSVDSILSLPKQLDKNFDSALSKYIIAALDFYFDVAIDTYDEETFGSVRSALRSPRFLQKFDQKANNKLAGKIKSLKLPSLSAALKSIKLST
jgi:hypothetical protein